MMGRFWSVWLLLLLLVPVAVGLIWFAVSPENFTAFGKSEPDLTAWPSPQLAQAPTQAQAQAQAQQPQQPPPPVPVLTEILNFDNWVVTCREFAQPKKRDCAALMQITQANTGQTIFTWTIGVDATNRPVAVFQTPTGVMIGPGVELRLEKAQPRKVPFTACDNGQCSATMPIDSSLVGDMMAAKNAEVVIQATNGSNLQFNLPLKGFDKAYAALR